MGFSLDYTNIMTPAQINAVNRKAYQRFSNFGSIDPIAQGRRFGRPFGSSVGEMTAEGPVRKLIPTAPMSGAEMGARLGFSALGPLGPFAALRIGEALSLLHWVVQNMLKLRLAGISSILKKLTI